MRSFYPQAIKRLTLDIPAELLHTRAYCHSPAALTFIDFMYIFLFISPQSTHCTLRSYIAHTL